MTKFLTIDEVAEMLRVHRNTICRWLKIGTFPNAINIEGTRRIPLSDVEALSKSSKEAV